jgi:hypothetical protein
MEDRWSCWTPPGGTAEVFWQVGQISTPRLLTDDRQPVQNVWPQSSIRGTDLTELLNFSEHPVQISTSETENMTQRFFFLGGGW